VDVLIVRICTVEQHRIFKVTGPKKGEAYSNVRLMENMHTKAQ